MEMLHTLDLLAIYICLGYNKFVFSPGTSEIQGKRSGIQVKARHGQVKGDCAKLQRIMTNLISNAIKYTPEGGRVAIKLQEKPPVIKGYGCYELTVQDSGIGMSPAF